MKEIENYTIEHAAKALYDYIKNIDVTNTKIGTYSESKLGGKKDVVASGHQIYDMSDSVYAWGPSTIYTFINNTTIDKSPIFDCRFAISLGEVLQRGINSDKTLTKEEALAITEKLKNLNSRKSLIVPVFPKKDYKITYKPDEKSKEVTSLEKCFSVKWTTDKETYKLVCTVMFETGPADNRKVVKFPITSYGKDFVSEKMEFWNGISHCTRSLLEMTEQGIIRPIEITDGMQSIVVDNQFVYWIHNGMTFVVGDWDVVNKKIVYRKDLTKRADRVELLKFLEKNIPLIGGHRHLIAPYNLYGVHKHNIKAGKDKKK